MQPQQQPAIELLSAPSGAIGQQAAPSKERSCDRPAGDTAADSSSSAATPVFQQPPWRQQLPNGRLNGQAKENGVPGSSGSKQQKHYELLSGTATTHLSKKEQRWLQQLQMPLDQWNSAQVGIIPGCGVLVSYAICTSNWHLHLTALIAILLSAAGCRLGVKHGYGPVSPQLCAPCHQRRVAGTIDV
jgi:hypothetical protein